MNDFFEGLILGIIIPVSLEFLLIGIKKFKYRNETQSEKLFRRYHEYLEQKV